MKYVEALEMLLVGRNAAEISRKAGFKDNWLSNTIHQMKAEKPLLTSTIRKLEEVLPSIQTLTKTGAADQYSNVKRRTLTPKLAELNERRKLYGFAGKPPIGGGDSAILDKLAELDGKLNLLLAELGCNGGAA